ncbi:MAG: hypothetical protein R3F11_24185 [Verrucomicrobiales bacterium]
MVEDLGEWVNGTNALFLNAAHGSFGGAAVGAGWDLPPGQSRKSPQPRRKQFRRGTGERKSATPDRTRKAPWRISQKP